MAERSLELLQDVTVDLRRCADDLKSDLLAERAAEVPHHAWEAYNSIGERPHAACQRLIVEPMGEICRFPIRNLKLDEPVCQVLLTSEDATMGVGHRRLRPLVERVRRKRFSQIVNRFGGFMVQPLQMQ